MREFCSGPLFRHTVRAVPAQGCAGTERPRRAFFGDFLSNRKSPGCRDGTPAVDQPAAAGDTTPIQSTRAARSNTTGHDGRLLDAPVGAKPNGGPKREETRNIV